MPEEDKKSLSNKAVGKVCPLDGKPGREGDNFCMDHGLKLVPRSERYIKLFANFALPFVPPLLLVALFWPLISAADIYIYAIIIMIVGTIGMFYVIGKHGLLAGLVITAIIVGGYILIISLINVIITGNIGIIYDFTAPFLPASLRDPWKTTLDSATTNLQPYTNSLKCALAGNFNFQNCATSNPGGGNNIPKICKPIEQYKFINIQFGEAPDYVLTNIVRVNNIYSAAITITPNGDRTISGITLSPNSELKDSNGNTVKMQADRCITPEENCQVGPSLPPLLVTLRTVGKVNFQVNDLAFLYVYVSYPFEQSGSNTFYIGNNRVDIQSELTKSQGPSLGIGPLDSHVTFSTNYYLTGSSINNPNAAKIEVDANVVNGKKNCYGEEGYGMLSQIKISHMSDIQGIAVSCKTPEGDSFSEDQARTVTGKKVTNIQTYPCTFTAPDSIGNIGASSIVFTSAISYTYTEVQLYSHNGASGMTVCPSDTSISCQ